MKARTKSQNIHIPSGKDATHSDMQEYGATLQEFVRTTETRLRKEKNTERYNETVDYLNLLAKNYNRELKIFGREESKRQLNTLSMFMQQRSQ